MSIDLDGNDYYIAEKLLNNGVRPYLFIMEYNSKFIPPIEFKIDYQADFGFKLTDYFGVSLASLDKLLSAHGYFLVCCNSFTGGNAFFVRNEHRHLFPEIPERIEDIWCPPMYFLPPSYGYATDPRTLEVLFRALQQDR